MPSALGGRQPAGRQRGDHRVVGERVGGAARGGRCVPSTTTSSSVVEHGPLALVERGERRGRAAPAASSRSRERRRRRRERAGVDDPAADRRRRAARRSAARARRRRPSPARRRPARRGGRAGPATPAATGCDVEHLAAADGLVAAGLAQHVAVARQQRQGRRGRCSRTSPVAPGRDATPGRARAAARRARPSRCRRGRRRAATRRGRATASTVERGVERGRVGRHRPGATTASPRVSSCVVDAGEVERDPVARARCASTARPSVWIARTRAGRPPGSTTTWSPAATEPSVSVPVTTVPLPLAAKTRSIHSRGRPRSAAAGVRAGERRPSAARSSSSPSPVGAATGTIGAPARNVPATCSATSSVGQLDELGVVEHVDLGEGDDAVADAEQLEDAQVLLALRLPALGGGDDEQAGVDAADAGEHVAQEAHVAGHVDEADRLAVDARRGRSRGRSSGPRRFSSANRSGSVPVSASTSDDLPWSTWPAVAIDAHRRHRATARRARRR